MFNFCLLVAATLAIGPQAVEGMKGGLMVEYGEARYHVFLMVGNRNFCNGALITSNYVLSAGFCVELTNEFDDKVTALAGTHNINNNGEMRDITSCIFAPGYEKLNLNWLNDVGIFTLESSIESSFCITTVHIPLEMRPIKMGAIADFTAAGARVFGGTSSSFLEIQSFRIISHQQCREMLPEVVIYDSYICGRAPRNRGICTGDNGGPLVIKNTLIGVAVGIINPCGGGHPDIFNNITNHINWILENTDYPLE